MLNFAAAKFYHDSLYDSQNPGAANWAIDLLFIHLLIFKIDSKRGCSYLRWNAVLDQVLQSSIEGNEFRCSIPMSIGMCNFSRPLNWRWNYENTLHLHLLQNFEVLLWFLTPNHLVQDVQVTSTRNLCLVTMDQRMYLN